MWVGVSGDLQGGADSVSQVSEVSDMALTRQLSGSVEGGFRKGTMAFAHLLSRRRLSLSSCLDARYFSFSL